MVTKVSSRAGTHRLEQPSHSWEILRNREQSSCSSVSWPGSSEDAGRGVGAYLYTIWILQDIQSLNSKHGQQAYLHGLVIDRLGRRTHVMDN